MVEFPPGTSAAQRRLLRLWRAWLTTGGALLWLIRSLLGGIVKSWDGDWDFDDRVPRRRRRHAWPGRRAAERVRTLSLVVGDTDCRKARLVG